jgi:DNA polymerase-3 subunit beta
MQNQTPIIVDTKTFTRELEWCARFIERKATIPILTNVLFQKRGDLLHMTATDLEVGGQTSVETTEMAPDFELAAPVHLLIKYLKKVDERTVSLLPNIVRAELREGPHPESCADKCCCDLEPTILSTALRIEHGSEASVAIDAMPAESFPELPNRPLATMEIGGFETAIPRACVSITHEESRFTLSGALLLVEGKRGSLISTDGHRLSVVDLKPHDSGRVKALIPRSALMELARLGDSAFFSEEANHVFFAVGVRTIVTRKMTGNFPDYERALPTNLNYATDVSVAPFRKVLDRVSLFADDRSHAVLITVNGALGVTANSCDRGGADGKVPIDCVRRLDGENGYDVLPAGLAYPYAAGFNAGFIMDFLKSADTPDVRFLFNKCSQAAEWNAPGWRYVIMPMRDLAQSSDPCAVGDFELLQWAKDEVNAQVTIEDAQRDVVPCATVAPVAPVRAARENIDPGIRTRAIELRRQQVPLAAIAKQLNAPQSSVWRWTRGA